MSLSKTEFERRYRGIRSFMSARGLDCLVVAGRADYFSRGNIRYITNLGTGGLALFPLEGKPVCFVSTAQIRSPKLQKILPSHDLLRFLEASDPLEQIAREARCFDRGGKIGIVGMSDLPVPVYLTLRGVYGERLVDATEVFARMRAVKSAEEIGKIRKAASVADGVCTMLQGMLRPGLVDYEIYGAVKRTIYEMGCEYSMELIDAEGSKMNMAWAPSGDILVDGGTLFLEITPAFDGYYAQLPVSLPVGGSTDRLRGLVDIWSEAMEAAVGLLKPGVAVRDVHRAAVESIKRKGFLSPFPAGHAIGLDVIDFWKVTETNETTLEPGMTLAVHPCVLAEPGGDGVGMGYTYLITDSGAEKLSAIDLTGWP